MDHEIRLKRLRFRAWHRGTREADLMIGGYFDAHHQEWTPDQLDWFETLLEEQDVDIENQYYNSKGSLFLSSSVLRIGWF